MNRVAAFCTVALWVLLAAACARAPQQPESYPYASSRQTVFVAGAAGLVELPAGRGAETLAPTAGPAALVPNASVLSADGRRILAAINRSGIALLEPSPDGKAFRIANHLAVESFAGRTVGGAWPRQGGFLVQLFRDPFADEAAPQPGSSSLIAVDAVGATNALTAPGAALMESARGAPTKPFFELFALFPSRAGGWLAELRKDSPDRVVTRYLSLSSPGSTDDHEVEVGRAAFETALTPQPLASISGPEGESLRRAVTALCTGPALIRVRAADGRDAWYSSAGGGDEALSLEAWLLDADKVLVLDGRGAAIVADHRGGAARLAFASPAEGAVFTAVAAASSLVAASWELGDFPEIRAAGIVVTRLP